MVIGSHPEGDRKSPMPTIALQPGHEGFGSRRTACGYIGKASKAENQAYDDGVLYSSVGMLQILQPRTSACPVAMTALSIWKLSQWTRGRTYLLPFPAISCTQGSPG
ncbi:hypothetical protein ASPCADRAFT_212423 [Aspergillus carbonarius ITEM 5010]|uniref:Uncharacterized protein n=1 Tax=Aspergillus carbonarius (strain ITEM 5010) TaxID=602072 RepID=A0A1R3R5X4_ASPC5|nr:hypothetical protein ASPCADRAFT_212423 [Aspergillus carbonarius ITEM 5010]